MEKRPRRKSTQATAGSDERSIGEIIDRLHSEATKLRKRVGRSKKRKGSKYR